MSAEKVESEGTWQAAEQVLQRPASEKARSLGRIKPSGRGSRELEWRRKGRSGSRSNEEETYLRMRTSNKIAGLYADEEHKYFYAAWL